MSACMHVYPQTEIQECIACSVRGTKVRALLHWGKGKRTGGYASFAWQERAHSRVTQMTHTHTRHHMPSLEPSLLCQHQGTLRHQRVICWSWREKEWPLPIWFPHSNFPNERKCIGAEIWEGMSAEDFDCRSPAIH